MPRLIKRYPNRKLYDTTDSHYVTLEALAQLIRAGEDISVVANDTRQDITATTLAQIIFEEERQSPRLPIEGLRRIIRSGMPV